MSTENVGFVRRVANITFRGDTMTRLHLQFFFVSLLEQLQ